MKTLSIVRLVLGTILAGSFISPTKAATFNFSFSNVQSSANGTVEGRIELPDGDGIFAATSVLITSAPSELGYSFPLDSFNLSGGILQNTFTVIDGMIDSTNSRFFNVFPGFRNAFALNTNGFGFRGVSFLDNSTGSFFGFPRGVVDATSSTLTYSSISVPEPTSIFSFLTLGILGINVLKCKQRTGRLK